VIAFSAIVTKCACRAASLSGLPPLLARSSSTTVRTLATESKLTVFRSACRRPNSRIARNVT
jgi:hypothetical protein